MAKRFARAAHPKARRAGIRPLRCAATLAADQSGQASGTASPKPIDDETNLDSVNQKLAGLNTNDDRMAQLDADPFEDSDEEDSAFDLDEYTEEEIG